MFVFFKSNTSLKTFIFLLTKYEKISWGISNNTGKTSTEVAYLFNWKPWNLPSSGQVNPSNNAIFTVGTPLPLWKGRGGGGVVGPCKNWVTWGGGGVWNFLLERRDKPERGVVVEIRGCHYFYYFTVQFNHIYIFGSSFFWVRHARDQDQPGPTLNALPYCFSPYL